MSPTGDLTVSPQGSLNLPPQARHRWGLDDGGEVAFLDLEDAILLIPGGLVAARRTLLEAVTDDDWKAARAGFGDADLATE